MNTSRNSDYLEDLVVGHFEGSLTPEQEQELAEAVSTLEDAKQLFLSYMRMEGRLHSLGRDGFLRDPDHETTVTPVVEYQAVASDSRNRLWPVLASLAACLLLMFVTSWSLTPESANAETVLHKAQRAASELIDRTYRLVISRSGSSKEPIEREVEINLRGEGQFLVRASSGSAVGSNGSTYWMARKSGPIVVANDYQAFYPELKSRFPIRRLVDALASPEEPFLLNMPKFLKLLERSLDIELVDSGEPDSYHLRATLHDGGRSGMRVVDLWIDLESSVILKAEIRQKKQVLRLELLESEQLSDQWYQYDFHFPDRKLRSLTTESR